MYVKCGGGVKCDGFEKDVRNVFCLSEVLVNDGYKNDWLKQARDQES